MGPSKKKLSGFKDAGVLPINLTPVGCHFAHLIDHSSTKIVTPKGW